MAAIARLCDVMHTLDERLEYIYAYCVKVVEEYDGRWMPSSYTTYSVTKLYGRAENVVFTWVCKK